MANPIVYNGMQGLGGGDAMARFTIRGQVYEYHMSKYDADKVQWLKTKSVGKALNLAKKYDHINFSPPAGASSAAKKALKWKDEHGDAVKGGTAVGWTRARQLADGGEMSVETVKRMYKFFQRHEKNKAINPEFKGEPWRDNGYVAWLIWGGDAGKSWAEKLWDQMEAADAKTAKDGLWDNVRKKRERGGKPARPGDEGYPEEETWKELTSKVADDMIETSRRLARLASEVILADRKKFNLQSKYNYWNNKLFGGELPRVPLKWNRSRTFGGAVYKSYVGDLILINKLVISDFLQMDEQRFDAILIHEMIHVWQGANGIREGSGGHGREFHRMAKALGSKAGFTIPLTEDISDMSVNDNIKSKEFVVVLFEGRGNPGHQLFNVSNWNRNKAQFTNDLQMIARMYNREFTVVLSSDRELMKMRTKNGVLGKRGNMSWSVSDAGFAKRIESEGRVLAKIKEKKFDASKPSKMLMGIGRYVATKLEDRYPSVDFKPEVEVAKLGEKDVVIMTVKSNRGRGELAIRAFFGETEIPRVTVHFKTQMNEMLWDRAGKYPTPKAVIDALDSKIKRSEQEAEFGAFKL
jgi:hypothetical protein